MTADTKRGAVVVLPETRPVLCQAAVQELQLAPALFTFATCSHTRTNDACLLEALETMLLFPQALRETVVRWVGRPAAPLPNSAASCLQRSPGLPVK